MPNTYVALATQTLGTAASSVTFSSISSSYTDLVLITSAKNNTGAQYRLQLSFNGDRSTSVYSVTKLTGNGSTAVSSRASNATYGAILIGTIGSTNFDNAITHIMNYSNTTTNKTVLSRGNETAAEVNAEVGLWRSTAAITSLTLDLEGGINFVAGSTFSLYGIANADQGSAKATGGIITEDSQYWYHTFGAAGTFTPKQALSCEYLIVAGGGGGGSAATANIMGGGGGGAGGLLTSSFSAASGTPYAVVIGAGGARSTALGNSGSDGVASSVFGISATGGGGGASSNTPTGNTGGSSGGGSSGGSGGTRVVGQGNIGGASSGSFNSAGGGGGGAGGAGATGVGFSYAAGAAGGVGLSVFGATYAAGGRGGDDGALANGAANTGNGGAAGGNPNSASGGSGIVIVRYAK